jgi:Fe-S cluster assembly ATPase SufC
MASAVATPLERQFTTIARPRGHELVQHAGLHSITLQFDLSRDIDGAAVDVETEAKIQEALASVMKQHTRLVIAQRISTVLQADKILVLDDGRIAAEGTHRELIESSPIYREIYDSQLGNGVTAR